MSVNRSLRRFLFIFLAILIVFYFLLPIFYLVTMAIKTEKDVFTSQPVWIFKPTLDNYRKVFTTTGFSDFLVNSLIISFSNLLISLLAGIPGGYALSRLVFRGKDVLLFGILSSRMITPFSIALPIYLIYMNWGLIDTHIGLIIVYLTFNLSLVVWITKSSFDEVPKEIEDSAKVDGCSPLGIFIRIAIPIASPGLIAAGILAWIFAWNEFLFALILTGRSAQTATVGLSNFFKSEIVEWGPIAAASTVVMTPVIMFSLVLRRYLIRGMTEGALK